MATGYTLDPQITALLEMGKDLPPLESMSAKEARDFYLASCAATASPARDLAKVENRSIPGPGGEIPVRIYWPKGLPAAAPMLTYFHGGGWVIGDLDTHDSPCQVLAEDAGCIVVSVDYRMAPEDIFPASAEDCIAAYAWVVANAAALGGDPARVAVGGGSEPNAVAKPPAPSELHASSRRVTDRGSRGMSAWKSAGPRFTASSRRNDMHPKAGKATRS